MSNYTISQILVVISMICIGSTYICKNKKTIMILCIIYGIFYGSHYLLLGATTGFVMNLVSITRNVWFYINAKKEKKNSKVLLGILVMIGIASGLLSYQDPFSIISMTGSTLSTYSIWQDNIKVYRILALPVSLCFILYAFHIHSLFSIISEFILLTVEIVGIIEYYLKNKKQYELNESI